MNMRNTKGITLIALIVTIIVLIIIAGISIATLTRDNGILRQTNVAKEEQIEANVREQVKLAVSAMRLAIAEASANDNSYKASDHTGLIQAKLVQILNHDKSGLNGEFGFGGNDLADDAKGKKLYLSYTGDDYQNACNDANAEIVFTVILGQKTVEITNETNSTLKDQNQNDVVIDVNPAQITVSAYQNFEEDIGIEGYLSNIKQSDYPITINIYYRDANSIDPSDNMHLQGSSIMISNGTYFGITGELYQIKNYIITAEAVNSSGRIIATATCLLEMRD